jgi:hypothetical protein
VRFELAVLVFGFGVESQEKMSGTKKRDELKFHVSLPGSTGGSGLGSATDLALWADYTTLASSNQPIQGRGTGTMQAMQPLVNYRQENASLKHEVSMQVVSRNLHTVGSARCII